MESQVTRLVDKVWDKLLDTPPGKRYMIAIAGIPGSGKTTLAQTVVTSLNARHATLDPEHPTYTAHPVAVFVPMDGFHLSRAQLSALPDPHRAHARRGAEFTFDAPSYAALVRSLSSTTTANTTATDSTDTIYAPSFSHATKDPVPDDIPIEPWHRVVVLEGNYLCLDREPWRAAAAAADERWFVEVAREVARARLAARHVRAGIVDTPEAGLRRADENDLPNGDEILQNRIEVDEVIVSKEDGSWVHQ